MFQGQKSIWNGFERYDFKLEGIDVIIVMPRQLESHRRWLWRARFFDAWPAVDLAMLESGWLLAYIDVADQFGGPEAMRRFDLLYKFLTEQHNMAKKTVLEGFSRGGLVIYNWAARNPEKVSCLYADNPVCDFKSWPGGLMDGPGAPESWAKCLDAYGLTETEAINYQLNPIDNLAPLAKAGIPLLHVYGDADEVVPFYENTQIIADRYQELGGTIELICKPSCKHHPHCLEDPVPIVNFMLQYS
jgi:pimeloyl-ACP methyl ester carboxylesterase